MNDAGQAVRDDEVAPQIGSGVVYPRRQAMRWFLRKLAALALHLLGDVKVTGREHLPKEGPVILVANHFHFADPVALLHLSRRQVEFVGGFRFPNAPAIVKFIPSLWGYLPAFRGGYSRSTLKGAASVLEQGGVLGIFPEAGAWADVLRPPRPGAAFLAVESGARVVPVGIDGFTLLFNKWRPRLEIRIGAPIGPFSADGAGSERRAELDGIGQEIMLAIAQLLPPERRGIFSEDAGLREAAEAVAAYPFSERGMRGM